MVMMHWYIIEKYINCEKHIFYTYPDKNRLIEVENVP